MQTMIEFLKKRFSIKKLIIAMLVGVSMFYIKEFIFFHFGKYNYTYAVTGAIGYFLFTIYELIFDTWDLSGIIKYFSSNKFIEYLKPRNLIKYFLGDDYAERLRSRGYDQEYLHMENHCVNNDKKFFFDNQKITSVNMMNKGDNVGNSGRYVAIRPSLVGTNIEPSSSSTNIQQQSNPTNVHPAESLEDLHRKKKDLEFSIVDKNFLDSLENVMNSVSNTANKLDNIVNTNNMDSKKNIFDHSDLSEQDKANILTYTSSNGQPLVILKHTLSDPESNIDPNTSKKYTMSGTCARAASGDLLLRRRITDSLGPCNTNGGNLKFIVNSMKENNLERYNYVKFLREQEVKLEDIKKKISNIEKRN
jgi:hypothetical protein